MDINYFFTLDGGTQLTKIKNRRRTPFIFFHLCLPSPMSNDLVRVTDEGHGFAYSSIDKGDNDIWARAMEAVVLELRMRGGRKHPVSFMVAIAAISAKLAALGPTGSPRRRECWTFVEQNVDAVFVYAIRRRFIVHDNTQTGTTTTPVVSAPTK